MFYLSGVSVVLNSSLPSLARVTLSAAPLISPVACVLRSMSRDPRLFEVWLVALAPIVVATRGYLVLYCFVILRFLMLTPVLPSLADHCCPSMFPHLDHHLPLAVPQTPTHVFTFLCQRRFSDRMVPAHCSVVPWYPCLRVAVTVVSGYHGTFCRPSMW